MKNKKILVIIAFIFLIILTIFIVQMLLYKEPKSEIYNENSLDTSKVECVMINNYEIQNERFLDDFIANQDIKNSNDMILEFKVDGKKVLLKLCKNGKDEKIISNEGIYWYYILEKDGEETKYPAFEYIVGKRVENVDGGTVIVSITERTEELGAKYPVDICRYKLR